MTNPQRPSYRPAIPFPQKMRDRARGIAMELQFSCHWLHNTTKRHSPAQRPAFSAGGVGVVPLAGLAISNSPPAKEGTDCTKERSFFCTIRGGGTRTGQATHSTSPSPSERGGERSSRAGQTISNSPPAKEGTDCTKERSFFCTIRGGGTRAVQATHSHRTNYTLALLFALLLTFTAHAQVINTYAGGGSIGHTGNGGSALLATLDSPTSVASDAAGNIYISDQQNSCVRKVDTFGIITTVAGTGISGYNGDNIAATAAQLAQNWGIAADAAGNIFIADQSNHRVRKVNTAGIITTIAGSDSIGNSGDGGPATDARIESPVGIAVDAAGNVYVGDYNNNRVRRIDPSGIIHAFAGNGYFGFGGDGGSALTASFGHVQGLATDNAGNVYICDADHNRVRKVLPSGIVYTIAGNGDTSYGGDTGPATAAAFNTPSSVCVSAAGVVYITDCHNNRVRRISTSGIITTAAGTGDMGFFGDGGPSIACKLSHPIGVVMDPAQNIFIADLDNVRIRKMPHVKDVRFVRGDAQSLSVCENEGRVFIDSLLAITDLSAGATDTWSRVSGPYHGSALVAYTATATGSEYAPTGLFYAPATGYIGNDTLIVRVTNGPDSDTTTIIISVIPPITTAGAISGPGRVCVGSAIILTENVGGGVWGSQYAFASVSAGVLTGISPGTDTITYTVGNGCSSLTTSKQVIVDSLPAPGLITGDAAVCVGNSISLADAVPAGTWSATNTNAVVAAGRVTGLQSGADTVLYTVADSFCSAFVTHIITVETFQQPPAITGNAEICVQATTTLNEADTGGVWSIENTNATYAVSGLQVAVTGITAGTDNISYSITNTCGTGSAIRTITIDPLPSKPLITEKQSVLFATPGYAAYQWSTGGSNIPGAVVDTYLVLVSGDYTVTVSNQYGCAAIADSFLASGCDAQAILIFPDPAVNVVHINWCKPVTARVLCMDGKNIKTIYNTNEVDLTGLPDAMYMLTLYDENNHKLISKKIVKISQ